MNNKERFEARVAVYLVLLKKGRILLQERQNTGYMDGYFGLPSGHLEKGETVEDALRREAREEIGVELRGKPRLAHTLYRLSLRENSYIDLFFVARYWRGEVRNLEPDKCSLLVWCPIDSLFLNTIGYIQHTTTEIRKRHQFSEIVTAA